MITTKALVCPISSLDVLRVGFNAVFTLSRLYSFFTGSYYSNSMLSHCPTLLSFSNVTHCHCYTLGK